MPPAPPWWCPPTRSPRWSRAARTSRVAQVRRSVVATGELAGLLASDDPTLSVTTSQPAAALAALHSARIPGYLEHGKVGVVLSSCSAEQVLRTLVAAGVPVAEARGRRTALEELFIRLTEEGS